MAMVRVDASFIRYTRWIVSTVLSSVIWFISAPLLSEAVRFIFETVHSVFIGDPGIFAKVSYYISAMNWFQEKAYNYGGYVSSGLTFYLMQKYGNFIDSLLIMVARRFDIEVVLPEGPDAHHAPALAPIHAPVPPTHAQAPTHAHTSASDPVLSSRPLAQGADLHSSSTSALSARSSVGPINGFVPGAILSPETTPRQRASTMGAVNGHQHHGSPRTADSPRKLAPSAEVPSPRGRSSSAAIPVRLLGEGGRGGSPAPDRGPDIVRKAVNNQRTEAAMAPAIAPVLADRSRTASNPVSLSSSNGHSHSTSAARSVNALVDLPHSPTPQSILASSLTSPRPRPGSGSFTPMSNAAAAATPPVERSSSAILTRTTSDRYVGRGSSGSTGSLVERPAGANPISPRPHNGGS